MQVITSEKLPIFNWAKDIEEDALKQAKNLANHPCTRLRVCLAPDAHSGYGMPIGGIIAVEKALIPNAVGVDIGCSMSAGKTNIYCKNVTKDTLVRIQKELMSKIPVGLNHHKEIQEHEIFSKYDWNYPVISKEFNSAKYQLGTLGGGNHFIELQEDNDGYLWYMVHSGSRNLGYKVGNYYNKLAENLCTKWVHPDVVKAQLAFLPEGTEEFNNYFNEMNICLIFAQANHEIMQNVIENTLNSIMGSIITERYYTRHNYASIENFNGKNYYIHRKGAVRAREKDIVIIPGSQGTFSYILQGLGNVKSFCSASHGAGRTLSRTKAREVLSLEAEQEKMSDIIHNLNTISQLDEAPSAYKDIKEVIMLESDLVKPLVQLKPIMVIKG